MYTGSMNKESKNISPETPLNSKNKSVSVLQRIKNILSENRKLFYWFGGLVIFAILLFSGLRVYFETEKKKKIAALYKLEIQLAEESTEAISTTELFIVENSKNKQGNLARYYLANYYIKKKDYKEAQKWLESIDLQIKDSQNTFTVLVLLSIANVYQIQGDYQSAIDTITNSELIFLEDYIIFELAQNLMLQGRTGEAKAHLRNILKDFKGRRLENLVKEILKVI